MRKLEHDLLTENYTKVYHEKDFKYNAPHTFTVFPVDPLPCKQTEALQVVHFQEGPIKETGINGVCNEDLIAMIICRLQHFNESDYACIENDIAIERLEETLLWLRKRTMGREKKGIEGTSEK